MSGRKHAYLYDEDEKSPHCPIIIRQTLTSMARGTRMCNIRQFMSLVDVVTQHFLFLLLGSGAQQTCICYCFFENSEIF